MCFAKSASLFRIWNTQRFFSFVSRPGATGDKGGIAPHINKLCPPSFMNQLYLFHSEIDKPNYFEKYVSERIWCILICTDRLTWSSVCHQSRQQQERFEQITVITVSLAARALMTSNSRFTRNTVFHVVLTMVANSCKKSSYIKAIRCACRISSECTHLSELPEPVFPFSQNRLATVIQIVQFWV